MKNYRVLNGCHNCANMKDFTDYDTDLLFVCLLQYPEMKDKKTILIWKEDKTVDAFATCDEWVSDGE